MNAMTTPVPYREALERALASIVADMRKDVALLQAEMRAEIETLKRVRLEAEKDIRKSA